MIDGLNGMLSHVLNFVDKNIKIFKYYWCLQNGWLYNDEKEASKKSEQIEFI